MADKWEEIGLVELRRNQRQNNKTICLSLSDTYLQTLNSFPLFSQQSEEFI